MTTTGKRCKEKNRRGEPCGAYVVRGSEYCYWHDPTKAEGWVEARRMEIALDNGGKHD